MHQSGYSTLRHVLFRLDPEIAHNISIYLLAAAPKLKPVHRWLTNFFDYNDSRLVTSVFGLRFVNPVGVAAGYDKNAIAIDGLSTLGIGHVEVGTITPKAQYGNHRPRIFRLPEDNALINCMGFPNHGMEKVAPRLETSRNIRLGLNIGKGSDTHLEQAVSDYSKMITRLQHLVDYLVINISSPNTPGLRSLERRDLLESFLLPLMELHSQICRDRPLLVKISPDISILALDDLLDVVVRHGVSGLIATNTSLSRGGLSDPKRVKTGGLSGRPLYDRSNKIIRHIYRQTGGQLPIIGVGGIDGVSAALEKIRSGASLIQVYTGLVYHGPGLIRHIKRGIAKELEKLGLDSVEEIVGVSI